MFGNMKAFEVEMTRLWVFSIAVEMLLVAGFFWVLYLILKAAIRDGINESSLGDSWARNVAREQARVEVKDLPVMRAER